MQSCYGVILRNHSYEKDPWIPGESPDSLGPLGTPLAGPWDPLGRARHPRGCQWTPRDHKNSHVSTSVQRQKPTIAASESFCCNASFLGLAYHHLIKGVGGPAPPLCIINAQSMAGPSQEGPPPICAFRPGSSGPAKVHRGGSGPPGRVQPSPVH